MIEKDDNEEDIKAYVKQTIDASETLRGGFKREEIDPYEYFSAKANSIFLWVVIVLERLEKAETEGEFKRYLAGFSESSGDMELLYTAVLSTFTERARIWITEILKWLIVGAEAFTIEQLKEAVEHGVPDKLLNFKRFLEVQCGAILRLVPADSENKFTVQLIHETLRSYLLDIDLTCNESFRIEEETSQEVASFCLRTLCSGKDSELTDYAARHWANHLSNVNVSSLSTGICSDLYYFFRSDGIKLWLSIILDFPVDIDGRFVYVEESYLQSVYECLRREKALRAGADNHEDLGPSNWALDIIDSPWKLEEIVGKSAAELWLYESLRVHVVPPAFWLSLKHYCKRNGQSMDNVSELQGLASGEFSSIRAWLNEGQVKNVQTLGLGVAYYDMRLWSKAVQHLKAYTDYENLTRSSI